MRDIKTAVFALHARGWSARRIARRLRLSHVRVHTLVREWRVPLTPAEGATLRLLCAGLENKEIAQEFGVSVRTVETHRRALYRKSRAKTACELGVWAERERMLEVGN